MLHEYLIGENIGNTGGDGVFFCFEYKGQTHEGNMNIKCGRNRRKGDHTIDVGATARNNGMEWPLCGENDCAILLFPYLSYIANKLERIAKPLLCMNQ